MSNIEAGDAVLCCGHMAAVFLGGETTGTCSLVSEDGGDAFYLCSWCVGRYVEGREVTVSPVVMPEGERVEIDEAKPS